MEIIPCEELPSNLESLWQVRAPGRLNLIGEHTDYNGGRVLPFAIGQQIQISAFKSEQTYVWSNDHPEALLWTTPVTGPQAWDPKVPGWCRYVAGCLSLVPPQTPVTLMITSDIPLGAGLSSSAALCCGILFALTKHNGQTLSRLEIAKLAVRVEHEYAGTRCGMMDQLAVLYSKAGSFTSIDFLDSENPIIECTRAHPVYSNYEAIALNTQVKHALSDSPYNERRQDCEDSTKALNRFFDLQADTLGNYSTVQAFQELWQLPRSLNQTPVLQEKLSEAGLNPRQVSRSTHAILENLRVEIALQALAEGDLSLLSNAMQGSHQSLRDLFEVSCPELEQMNTMVASWAVDQKTTQCSQTGKKLIPLIGPRLCGGGFGGSTIQLVRKDLTEMLIQSCHSKDNSYFQKFSKQPGVLRTESADGISMLQL